MVDKEAPRRNEGYQDLRDLLKKFEEMGVKHSNALKKLLEDDPNLLKELGVEVLVSVSAVGSLTDDCPPGSFFLPDQFIDWTKK